MTVTYWEYIRVEELLRLQGGLGPEDEAPSDHEVLFITVHQVFELWFMLVLRELAALRDLLGGEAVPEVSMAEAVRRLDRIGRIVDVANRHWRVVESLSTRDYLEFRDRLFPASGFQSAQMREIEILLGLPEAARVGLGRQGAWRDALRGPRGASSPALERVRRREADRPSLREALDAWLYRTPIRGSRPEDEGDAEIVEGFVEDYLASHRRTIADTLEERLDARLDAAAREGVRERYRAEIASAQAWLRPSDPRRRRVRAALLFIEAYRDLPLLALPREVLDKVVEMEQGLLIFRQRHARMVERVIGRRVGTGGSSGVAYLDETALAYRVFEDLWTARTLLLPAAALPPLADPAYYALRHGA